MRFPTLRRSGAALVLCAVASATPAPAQDALSAAQKSAVDAQIRAYILENPEVLLEALAILEARREAAQAEQDADLIAANAEALFADGFSQSIGPADADVVIVEFTDYRCGYCKAAHPLTRALLEKDGRIRLVVKEFPILGPESLFAGRAAMAAASLDPAAYLRLNDALMGYKGKLDAAAVMRLAETAGLDRARLETAMADPAIEANLRRTQGLAEALGINGTPAFVIGDQVVRGFVQAERLSELVAAARQGG
jgi:protein-disulfide isomerase